MFLIYNLTMKIIISPSKTFDLTKVINETTPRPKYIQDAKGVFGEIRKLSLEDTKRIYSLSDKKAKEVYEMHLNHGQKLYYAIDMFSGLVFKQLELEEYDKDWLNENLIILDALYGVIKPFDLIAPYRLDFKTNIGIDLEGIWKEKINEELKGHKIINLASKEFSTLVEHNMDEVTLDKGLQIKIARGKALHKLIKNNQKG